MTTNINPKEFIKAQNDAKEAIIDAHFKGSIEYMDNIPLEEHKIINTDFLKELVEGVLNNINDIDNNISKYLENWTIDRLGLTDQAIIRISVYELLYTNTPNLVCINEAIELSKKYSDEKVSKMINGVLDKIYHEVEDKSE